MPEPIDVRDRVPEPLDDVLVFGRLGDDGEPEWHKGYLTLERGNGMARARWHLIDSSTDPLRITDVTHWMPLPPDPRPPLRAVA